MTNYVSDFDIHVYRMANSETEQIHFSYLYEKEFMDLIRSGDVQAVKRRFAPQIGKWSFPDPADNKSGIGIMSRQAAKQKEYAAVLIISFAARTAIEAGMNAFDAYDLNDLYLQRISELPHESDLIPLMQEAIIRFTEGINKAKREKCIPLAVRTAQDYINRNLVHELTVKNIAEVVGLTPNYLSALFRSETGMTISEYITAKRIEAAENSLKYSDISIDQISEYLCFHSRSYFGSVFKKKTGYSPAQYRKNNAASAY